MPEPTADHRALLIAGAAFFSVAEISMAAGAPAQAAAPGRRGDTAERVIAAERRPATSRSCRSA
jgi:hypothetical protein